MVVEDLKIMRTEMPLPDNDGTSNDDRIYINGSRPSTKMEYQAVLPLNAGKIKYL
jgi:hypothetical protein